MNRNFLKLLILTFILIGCGSNQIKFKVDKPTVDTATKLTPVNLDDDFNVFIQYFSKDSLFQISRIDFPFTIREYDVMNDTEIVRTIDKSNFKKLDFTIKKTKSATDNWQQEININKNKATIEIRGIENGIMLDIFFEKKFGQWKFVTWVDHST